MKSGLISSQVVIEKSEEYLSLYGFSKDAKEVLIPIILEPGDAFYYRWTVPAKSNAAMSGIGNYLTLFERARNELMRSCGYTYKQCQAEGWMLPVVHAELDYHRPARYDDLLEVTAWCKSHKGVRLEIACEVRVKGEDAVLVNGHTQHCFVSQKSADKLRLTA